MWTVKVVQRMPDRPYAVTNQFLGALEVISDDEYNEAEDRLARVGSMLTRLGEKARREHRRTKSLERRGAARRGASGASADRTSKEQARE